MKNQYSELVLGVDKLDTYMQKGKKIGDVFLNSIAYLVEDNNGIKIHNNKFIPFVELFFSATLVGFSLNTFFEEIEKIAKLNENLISINCRFSHMLPALDKESHRLPALDKETYCIYSVEHSGWWRKKKMGYIKKFSFEECFFTKNLIEAENIVSDGNKGNKHLNELLVTMIF